MRKILALCTVAVLSMALFTGCGKSADKTYKIYANCVETVNYTGIEYVPVDRTVTQENIDSAIKTFCNNNSVTEQDYISAIKEEDLVYIDYTEKLNGSEYASETDFGITIGHDRLGAGFDEQLIGAKPGEVREVTVTYPDDYSDVTLAGLTVAFDVTVKYISVTTVPEYNDDLVKTATGGEYTTTESYTAYLTEDLQNSKNETADNSERAQILQAIIDETTFTKYPEQEMEKYIINIVDTAKSSADSYGIDFETFLAYFYGYSSEQEFLNYLSETVTAVLKERIVVCSIALKENLVATDADIDAYKIKTMAELGITENELPNYYMEDDLAFFATEEKVLDYLIEQAVQVEELEEASEE